MIVRCLYIIGLVAFISSIVVGIMSGSLFGFVISIVSGFCSTIIFFALARILEKQDDILYMLQNQEKIIKSTSPPEKKECKKCNYRYDYDYRSCPKCGYRN